MRIRKSYAFPSISKKNCTLTLIGGNQSYLERMCGFKRRDNALESGLGAVKQGGFTTFTNVSKTFVSAYSGNLFFIADGGAYVRLKSGKRFEKIKDDVAEGAFFADMYIDGNAATVLYSDGDRLVFCNGLSSTTDEHVFSDGIIHCGRFFGCDKNEGLKIWWASGNPMEWQTGIDGCGYIYLPTDGGKVLRLFNFEEKLIAVRERGITVISAYGEPQHYAVKETGSYYTADGIIAETCAMCDSKLFFCTASGIFAFDGDDIERQENDVSYDISAYQCAVAAGDRYFVLCDGDKFGNGALFVYEAAEKCGYFTGINCLNLAGGDSLYAFCEDGFYTFEENVGEGSWQSSDVNFGSRGAKLLKEVYLECEGDISLQVVCGDIVRTFHSGRSAVGLFGGSFKFNVGGKGRITSLTATAEVRGGI